MPCCSFFEGAYRTPNGKGSACCIWCTRVLSPFWPTSYLGKEDYSPSDSPNTLQVIWLICLCWDEKTWDKYRKQSSTPPIYNSGMQKFKLGGVQLYTRGDKGQCCRIPVGTSTRARPDWGACPQALYLSHWVDPNSFTHTPKSQERSPSPSSNKRPN